MSAAEKASRPITAEGLMEAVQDQRSRLINVLGALQCMRIAVRSSDPPAEEADYIDLGSGNSGSQLNDTFTRSAHADSSTWAAYAIGFLPVPLPIVEFYGKVGVARWQLKEDLIDVANFPPPSTSVFPRSFSGTDFA